MRREAVLDRQQGLRAVNDPKQSLLIPLTRMQRFKRAYAIDIEVCPDCGGTLRVIACIEEPALIARIVGHVRQREGLNGHLTRAPPGQQEVTFNLN
jgi:hypothetical protein